MDESSIDIEIDIPTQPPLLLILSFLFCFKILNNLKETGEWTSGGQFEDTLKQNLRLKSILIDEHI